MLVDLLCLLNCCGKNMKRKMVRACSCISKCHPLLSMQNEFLAVSLLFQRVNTCIVNSCI